MLDRLAMKGSDKWGQGSGPRLGMVVASLVAVSVVGIAFYYVVTIGNTSAGQRPGVVTVSTTGLPCDAHSLPQAAALAQRDSRFLGLSGGRCYDYLGESSSNGSNATLTFAYYNGTISYPCGTSPVQVPAAEIEVVESNGAVASVRAATVSALPSSETCDPSIPVRIFGVDDVESTIPAVPQLNLTLVAADRARPVTSLRAVLALDGGSQTFDFNTITSSRPLNPGASVSKTEIVLSTLSFASNEVYPMVVSGSFDNGQAFSYTLHFQITHIP